MLAPQWKEIRALPHLARVDRVRHAAAVPCPLRQWMQILPAAAVVRPIKQDGAAHLGKARTDSQIPGVAVLPRARVAKPGDLQAWWRRRNHRLAELLPDLQLRVGRSRKALHFAQPLTANRLIRRLRNAGVENRRHVHLRQDAPRKNSKGIE